MARIERSVGIDRGKDVLDVCGFPRRETTRRANIDDGHKALSEWVTDKAVCPVGIEASGGYERRIRRLERLVSGKFSDFSETV